VERALATELCCQWQADPEIPESESRPVPDLAGKIAGIFLPLAGGGVAPASRSESQRPDQLLSLASSLRVWTAAPGQEADEGVSGLRARGRLARGRWARSGVEECRALGPGRRGGVRSGPGPVSFKLVLGSSLGSREIRRASG
jgi:hypothetical protein